MTDWRTIGAGIDRVTGSVGGYFDQRNQNLRQQQQQQAAQQRLLLEYALRSRMKQQEAGREDALRQEAMASMQGLLGPSMPPPGSALAGPSDDLARRLSGLAPDEQGPPVPSASREAQGIAQAFQQAAQPAQPSMMDLGRRALPTMMGYHPAGAAPLLGSLMSEEGLYTSRAADRAQRERQGIADQMRQWQQFRGEQGAPIAGQQLPIPRARELLLRQQQQTSGGLAMKYAGEENRAEDLFPALMAKGQAEADKAVAEGHYAPDYYEARARAQGSYADAAGALAGQRGAKEEQIRSRTRMDELYIPQKEEARIRELDAGTAVKETRKILLQKQAERVEVLKGLDVDKLQLLTMETLSSMSNERARTRSEIEVDAARVRDLSAAVDLKVKTGELTDEKAQAVRSGIDFARAVSDARVRNYDAETATEVARRPGEVELLGAQAERQRAGTALTAEQTATEIARRPGEVELLGAQAGRQRALTAFTDAQLKELEASAPLKRALIQGQIDEKEAQTSLLGLKGVEQEKKNLFLDATMGDRLRQEALKADDLLTRVQRTVQMARTDQEREHLIRAQAMQIQTMLPINVAIGNARAAESVARRLALDASSEKEEVRARAQMAARALSGLTKKSLSKDEKGALWAVLGAYLPGFEVKEESGLFGRKTRTLVPSGAATTADPIFQEELPPMEF